MEAATARESTMDHTTTRTHATVKGAGDHSAVRRTNGRAEMCAGELRPRKA